MSLRAALLLSALPTIAAAQDIDTGEIHACVASCLADRGTVEFIQYGQCITDLCASLATGTGAAAEMAVEMAEAAEDDEAEDSGIQNETLLILGDEAQEAEEPAPQPVVSANAGVNLDAPAEANSSGDATMNAVPVPVEVDEAPDEPADEGGDGTDDEMNADIAETPAAAPEEQAGEDSDTAMNADITESPTEEGADEEMAEDTAAGDAMAADDMMAEDTGEGVADAMADDAASPDIVADDAASPDAMADDAMAEDAMADDAMAEDASPDMAMAEDATSDATNQIITEDAEPEPVADPISRTEWQVVTLSASEAPWVDGFGAIIGGEGGLQFGYLCARSGVSHLTLVGDTVASRPGVYTVVVGQGQYLTPPMVATGGRLQAGISPNDQLLAALRAGNVADVYGPDRALVSRFELKGSSAAIATALESCF